MSCCAFGVASDFSAPWRFSEHHAKSVAGCQKLDFRIHRDLWVGDLDLVLKGLRCFIQGVAPDMFETIHQAGALEGFVGRPKGRHQKNPEVVESAVSGRKVIPDDGLGDLIKFGVAMPHQDKIGHYQHIDGLYGVSKSGLVAIEVQAGRHMAKCCIGRNLEEDIRQQSTVQEILRLLGADIYEALGEGVVDVGHAHHGILVSRMNGELNTRIALVGIHELL